MPDDAPHPDRTPDIALDVPNLSVDELEVEVDGLEARLSLDARLGGFVQLHAGVSARMDRAQISVKGVQAETQLRVFLSRVESVFEQALQTLAETPALAGSLEPLPSRAGHVFRADKHDGGPRQAGTPDRSEDGVLVVEGQTLFELLPDGEDGLRRRPLADLGDLDLVDERTDEAGCAVRTVRHGDAVLIRYATNAAGEVVGGRVIES